ncbi:MAG: presenilin family intramembrane aspartyl protease PSH [Halobacteriota archaeon]
MSEEEEEEVTETETEEKNLSIFLCLGMAVLLVLTQVIAVLLAAPFAASGIKAFQDPESMWNTVYFIILIIGFTALILLVLKFGGDKLVQFIMLAAVAVTMYYVMAVLVPYGYVPIVITIALTVLLYIYPEWYILDATGLVIGGGAAAMFGISLDILPVILLMILLAIYDAISVYKTKHMVSLAESIVEMRLPILFVLPRKRNFSIVKNSDMGEAFFMGLGDAIIPSMLVVSAFVNYTSAAPALGAALGTLAGYAVLSRIAGRGKPHAGLPLLNSGAIMGFVIGLALLV